MIDEATCPRCGEPSVGTTGRCAEHPPMRPPMAGRCARCDRPALGVVGGERACEVHMRETRIHCGPYAASMSADSCLSTRSAALSQRATMGPASRQTHRHAACLTCPEGAARAAELGDARPPTNNHAGRRGAPRLIPSDSLTTYVPRRR